MKNEQEEIEPSEEQKSNLKFKIFLIFLVIIIVLVSKFVTKQIGLKDFLYIPYSFDFKRLYDVKEYIIFFIIIIPIVIYLNKSNTEWVRNELDKFEKNEEKRLKEIEEKKQEEFERKMAGIKFKSQ